MPLTEAEIVQFYIALDGSGAVHEHPTVSLAGVGGDIHRHWSPFLDEWWAIILDEYGLPHFRMAEAMNFTGPFKTNKHFMGDDREVRRDALLLKLVGLARKHELRGLGYACDVRSLTTEKGVQAQKRELFQRTITGIFSMLPENYLMVLLCDDEQDSAMDYYRYVNRLRRAHPATGSRIAGLAFMDDKRMPHIQLADMIAYLLREEAERRVERPSDPSNPLLLSLLSGSRLIGPTITEGHFEP